MQPTSFIGQTHVLGKPRGWDEKTQGKCEGLPVVITDDGIYSRWKLSFIDRIKVLFGTPITLVVNSGSMPPVALQVTEPMEATNE